jgi:hypothetical protein
MIYLLPELFKFEILPYIDITLYGQMLQVNKQFYYNCLNGDTNIVVKHIFSYNKGYKNTLLVYGKANVQIDLLLHGSFDYDHIIPLFSDIKILRLFTGKIKLMNTIYKLQNIKALAIYNNMMTNNCISKFTQLKMLYIHGCENITNEGISKLNNLEILYLRDTNITPNYLGNLPNLKIVYISSRVLSYQIRIIKATIRY